MSESVNSRRRYDSEGRREQARQTRARVLAVAHDMFLADGYSATTVPAVARAAGVSAPSAYKAFGNKSGLAKAVFDVAIAGDDRPETMLEREALTRVRLETDPRQQLRLYALFVADTAPRHVPVQLLIRDAAASDADAAQLWRQLSDQRLAGIGMFARALTPHLRDGVSVEDARDLLWAHNSAEHWDLLVNQRGWPPQKYADHLARTLIHALLPA